MGVLYIYGKSDQGIRVTYWMHQFLLHDVFRSFQYSSLLFQLDIMVCLKMEQVTSLWPCASHEWVGLKKLTPHSVSLGTCFNILYCGSHYRLKMCHLWSGRSHDWKIVIRGRSYDWSSWKATWLEFVESHMIRIYGRSHDWSSCKVTWQGLVCLLANMHTFYIHSCAGA
jgi:hypothetical protein